MPFILDDQSQIKKIDKSHIYKSIETLADQIRQVLEEAHLIRVPFEFSKINKVIVNGMGASNVGASIIKAVFSEELKVPISITPGYSVPAKVDENTLYILSSYSGNTEEVLSVYKEVKKRGAKIMGITTKGKGKLEKLMIKENIPGYIYSPRFNPSGVPRLGLGYNAFGLAILMAKTGLFKINIKEIKNIIAKMEIWDREFRPEVSVKNNKAKKIAIALHNTTPIAVGAEFLTGNLRILRNQFCESGKNFASYLIIPELNHYALEGLANPLSNRKNLLFFFIDSSFYHPRNKERIMLTKKVVKNNKIKQIEYKLGGETKLSQSFELLQLGGWASYYLGILNKVDPATNQFVDWFKENLK